MKCGNCERNLSNCAYGAASWTVVLLRPSSRKGRASRLTLRDWTSNPVRARKISARDFYHFKTNIGIALVRGVRKKKLVRRGRHDRIMKRVGTGG